MTEQQQDKLDLIINGQQDLREAMIRLEASDAQQTATLGRLVHKIEGNGDPGLLTRTDRLEQKATLIQWLVGGVAGGFGVLMLAWATHALGIG